eukprot:scaffold149_cov383-Prasinococcus_capsulatus_cf.AAC.21
MWPSSPSWAACSTSASGAAVSAPGSSTEACPVASAPAAPSAHETVFPLPAASFSSRGRGMASSRWCCEFSVPCTVASSWLAATACAGPAEVGFVAVGVTLDGVLLLPDERLSPSLVRKRLGHSVPCRLLRWLCVSGAQLRCRGAAGPILPGSGLRLQARCCGGCQDWPSCVLLVALQARDLLALARALPSLSLGWRPERWPLAGLPGRFAGGTSVS